MKDQLLGVSSVWPFYFYFFFSYLRCILVVFFPEVSLKFLRRLGVSYSTYTLLAINIPLHTGLSEQKPCQVLQTDRTDESLGEEGEGQRVPWPSLLPLGTSGDGEGFQAVAKLRVPQVVGALSLGL